MQVISIQINDWTVGNSTAVNESTQKSNETIKIVCKMFKLFPKWANTFYACQCRFSYNLISFV